MNQSVIYGHGAVGNGAASGGGGGAASKPAIQPISIIINPPSPNVISNSNINNGAASPSQMKPSGVASDSVSRPGK